MKDKIISFILIFLIILILCAIGILGYVIYSEIMNEGTIVINFEGENGYPTIEYKKPSESLTIDDKIFDGVNDNASSQTENKNDILKSRYLYKQLSNTAQIIYDKLYDNKENLKTGTYKIEFANTFQTLLAHENGEKELKEDYQSAIEALVYENPDIFYLDVTKLYINIEKISKITEVKYNVYIDNGNDVSYYSEGFYSKEDIEKYENQIQQVKNQVMSNLQGMTNYQKIKAIHDYLIDTISYETDLSKNNLYDIYGALVEKRCVCEGYAKAFQYFMNECGIQNTIVIGKGTNSKKQTESHAWNYVQLDNNWYAVDVTWDDPIITGGGKLTSKTKYKYFLKGAKTMEENHFAIGKFTEKGRVFTYPALCNEDYGQ